MSISIPIPPLSEQKHIVKKLDTIFEKMTKAKENAEKNLLNAKELFASYLHNIFANRSKDWQEQKLGDVCDVITGGDVPKNNFSKVKNDNFQIPIFSNGMKNNRIIWLHEYSKNN